VEKLQESLCFFVAGGSMSRKESATVQVEFPMDKFGDLPVFLKRDYSSIRQALGRGSHA